MPNNQVLPKVTVTGTFEATYISTPKDASKPVYVQANPQGLKNISYTFSFPQAICPVQNSGDVWKGEMVGSYQVYRKPAGEKDSHNFAIVAVNNLERFKTELVKL